MLRNCETIVRKARTIVRSAFSATAAAGRVREI